MLLFAVARDIGLPRTGIFVPSHALEAASIPLGLSGVMGIIGCGTFPQVIQPVVGPVAVFVIQPLRPLTVRQRPYNVMGLVEFPVVFDPKIASARFFGCAATRIAAARFTILAPCQPPVPCITCKEFVQPLDRKAGTDCDRRWVNPWAGCSPSGAVIPLTRSLGPF
jgi:hypothetical protein